MRELQAALPRIKGRWMTGGSAAPYAPAAWQPLLGGADPDLALLALVGELSRIALRPTPAGPLQARPLLPRLELPTLAQEHRPRLRRALEAAKSNAALRARILQLLAARGHAVHPADWLPESSRETWPALYDPWSDWLSAQRAPAPQTELSEQSWDEWPPRQRLEQLRELRRREPARALALIAARAPAEKAEPRARAVETLAIGLCELDAPFLESLGGDRSPQVRAVAAALLARLGRVSDRPDLLEELIAFLEFRKAGLLRRQPRLAAPQLKGAAAARRRGELFELLSLAGLARALELSELELVQAWTTDTGERMATASFVQMAARSGCAPAKLACLQSLLEQDVEPGALLALTEGLDAAQRASAAAQIRKRDDASLEASAVACGAALGETPLAELRASDAFAALLAALAASLRGAAESAASPWAAGLANLGLLADREAARAIAEELVQRGLSPADPRLDLLLLNASLTGRTRA